MAVATDIGCVTVFGGSGYLGCEIVKRLSAAGIVSRIAVRNPDSAVLPSDPRLAEISAVYADVRDESSVALAIEGSDAVVNAVGLYWEHGFETFEAIHVLGALNVAHQAAEQGIKHLIHFSGIGADLNSPSSYVRSRAKGELLVHDVFSEATVLRPSVMFGPTDKFLNTLVTLTKFLPGVPLFGRGNTQLQPIYVGDVAMAVLENLRQPLSQGKTYELGGPRIYTYRALIELVLKHSKRYRLLIPVPFLVWRILAGISSFLPTPPITPGQVELMNSDNVVGPNTLSLGDLGVIPTQLEDILSEYDFSKLT